MKKFKKFKDLKIKSPLDNPEFYALLLADSRYQTQAFSKCHNYRFGGSRENVNAELANIARIAMKVFRENYTSFEKFNLANPTATEDDYNRTMRVIEGLLKRNNLEEILNFYCKHQSGFFKDGLGVEQGPWKYFMSFRLNPENFEKNIESKDVKHRLYMAVDYGYRAQIAEEIIKRCNTEKIPYFFKIFTVTAIKPQNQQSDTMVFYLADEEQVVSYVNFINEIIEQHPELKEHIHKTPPHLGIINDYIGYGFEPKIENGKTSYSKALREACIGLPINTTQLTSNTFSKLSEPSTRQILEQKVISQEAYDNCPKSEWRTLLLAPPEIYEQLAQLAKKSDKNPDDYETLRKYLLFWIRRDNMQQKIIQKLRKNISTWITRKYKLQEGNLFDINQNIKLEGGISDR